MKAIASAAALAEETGSRLQVVWFRDRGLDCPFCGLFEPPLSSQGKPLTVREARFADKFFLDRPRRKNLWLPLLYQQCRFSRISYEEQTTRRIQQEFDFRTWAEGENVYIAACVAFHPFGAERLSTLFRPIAPLQQRIDELTHRFAPHTVGVHIRRTDHITASNESPTNLFVRRMKEEIEAYPDTHFYLATDSEKEKWILCKTFGPRILTSPRPAVRHTTAGMQDALVELYALSHTCRILGSARSTYSETAALMGGISCETIRREP